MKAEIPADPELRTPKAVIIVVIDQLSSEAYSRIKPGKGFEVLTARSLFYHKARYPYLHPETCPGHATISTGFYPSSHGIVANNWRDLKAGGQFYCVEDAVYKRSPAALLKPTLGDILKEGLRGTSVVTVSGKDRAAIMLAGYKADQALWYDRESGNFISSSFYPPVTETVLKFNRQKHWQHDFSNPWVLPSGRKYSYGFSIEPDPAFFDSLYKGPALDRLTFNLFKDLIENRDRSASLSYFGLSLSSLDTVGHTYGPYSEEYKSVLSQLARIVADLLIVLDKEFGTDGYILALTADHGVLPTEGEGNGYVSADDVQCARANKSNCINLAEKICYKDLKPESTFYSAAKNSFFVGRSEDCLAVYKQGLLPALPPGTSHLTPWQEDTEVPLWLLFPDTNSRTSEDQISPAAIAPTILKAIGTFENDSVTESFPEAALILD